MRKKSKLAPRGRQKAYPMTWSATQDFIGRVRADYLASHRLKGKPDFSRYAVILIGFGTGVRATDMESMKWDDFIGHDEGGYYAYEAVVLYEHKKRHLASVPSQRIPLFESFRKLILEAFLLEKPRNHDSYIFTTGRKYLTTYRRHLSSRTLNILAKKVMEQYKLVHPTRFYSLMRCTWARALYDTLVVNGMTEDGALQQLSYIMNHSSTTVTASYIGLGYQSAEMMRAVKSIGMIKDSTSDPIYDPEKHDNIPGLEPPKKGDTAPDEVDWDRFTDMNRELLQANFYSRRLYAKPKHLDEA